MAARKKAAKKKTAKRAKKSPTVSSPQIQKVKLSQLTFAPYNPREISEEALAGLKASLKRFGIVEPIVWNKKTGNVVGGHQRIKVLQEEGITETQVVVVNLSKAEEKALNVALNNPHIAGDFTDDLGGLLEVIKTDSIELFEMLRLDELLPKFDMDELDASPALGGLEYRVIVDCADETHQEDTLRKLEKMGYTCRALIS